MPVQIPGWGNGCGVKNAGTVMRPRLLLPAIKTFTKKVQLVIVVTDSLAVAFVDSVVFDTVAFLTGIGIFVGVGVGVGVAEGFRFAITSTTPLGVTDDFSVTSFPSLYTSTVSFSDDPSSFWMDATTIP